MTEFSTFRYVQKLLKTRSTVLVQYNEINNPEKSIELSENIQYKVRENSE